MEYRFMGEWIIPIGALILAIAVEILPYEFWGGLWDAVGKAGRLLKESIREG